MKVSKEKKEMLCRLMSCIQKILKITIGLSTPYGSVVNDDDEFIIYASLLDEVLPFELLQDGIEHNLSFELIHKSDFRRDIICGAFVDDGVAEFMVGEGKVKDFLATIDKALLDGTIYFAPARDFILGGRVVTLTKEPDNTWVVRVKSNHKTSYFSVSPSRPLKTSGDLSPLEFQRLVADFEA